MDKVLEIAHGSNHGAPLTIRANPLKVTRDDIIRRLKQNYAYEVRIVFHARLPLYLLCD